MLNVNFINSYEENYMDSKISINIEFISNPFLIDSIYGPTSIRDQYNGYMTITSNLTWKDISNNRAVSPLAFFPSRKPQDSNGLRECQYSLYFPYITNEQKKQLNVELNVKGCGYNLVTKKYYVQTFTDYLDNIYTSMGTPTYALYSIITQTDLCKNGTPVGSAIPLNVNISCNAPCLYTPQRYVLEDGRNIQDLTIYDILDFIENSSSKNIYYVNNRWNLSAYSGGYLIESKDYYVDLTWEEDFPPKSYIYYDESAGTYHYILNIAEDVVNYNENISDSTQTTLLPGGLVNEFKMMIDRDNYYDVKVTPTVWDTNIPIFNNKDIGDEYITAINDGDQKKIDELLLNAENSDKINKPYVKDIIDISIKPSIPSTTTNNLYLLNDYQFSDFLNIIYSADFIENIKNDMFGVDILANIINVRAFPIDIGANLITQQVTGLLFGTHMMEINGVRVINNNNFIIDCGSVFVSRRYYNYYDYAPYTTISLYLPFYGIVDLQPEIYNNSSVGIKYVIDVVTGFSLICVFKNESFIQSFTTNVSYNIAFSANNYTNYMQNIVNNVFGATANIATGKFDGLAGNVMGLATNKVNAIPFGEPSSTVNMALPMYPYILMTYHKYTKVNNEQEIYGYPSNTIDLVSNFTGFLQTSFIDVKGVPKNASDAISTLFSNGVYI